MKAKITDLMDLYEDRNCPLSPTADQSEEALNDRSRGEDGRNPVEIKASRHRYGWKEFSALAAVLVLLVLSGFAVRQLLDRRGLQPGQTGDPGQTETRFIGGEHTLEQEEQLELNRFLTAFAQQGVENLDADLDEDAELIRFAFIYRRIYDPESIPVQPDDDGELWDTLSPEQVNETLTRLLGRTVTPDETADYNLLRSDPVGGHCSFHDGYFWQEPSGGDHLLRFVLTDRPLRMEDAAGPCVITDFTAYAVNLTLWPLVELDALPALSQEEAEALVQAEKLKPILTGRAQARITEDGYRLWSLASQPYELDDEEDPHTEPTGFDTVPDDEWDQINGQLTNAARMDFPELDGNGAFASVEDLYPYRFAQAAALTDQKNDSCQVAFEAYEADPALWPEFLSLDPSRIENVSELLDAGKIRVIGSGSADFQRENGGMRLKNYTFTPLQKDAAAPDSLHLRGESDPEIARLSRFLTAFAQQGIEDSREELDEDAELVRFVFRYRQLNDPKSILEQKDGDASARTLTLDQVNETLNALLGKTLSPDGEDYCILTDEADAFYCFYRDGRFWYIPPYDYDGEDALRFAKVERWDEATGALKFRVYRVNLANWPDAEAYLGLLPVMTVEDLEGSTGIVTKLAEGEAVLEDLSGDPRLVEYAVEPVH